MTESATAHAAIAADACGVQPADSVRRQAKCSRATAAEAGRRGEWPSVHSPLGGLAVLVTALWGRMACLTLKPAPGVRVLVTRRPARESSSPGTW